MPASTPAPEPGGPAAPVVLVSWDGRSPPLAMLELDTPPRFELVLFDYSGGNTAPQLPPGVQATVLRQKTECKGELYAALGALLQQRGTVPEFVGLLDDDILISVSGVHRMMHIARVQGLHAFQAALTHDSHHTHRWTLRQGHRLSRPVDWVEVMMPFYAGALFMAVQPHLQGCISSWGVDRYLVPAVQQAMGLTRNAVVEAVQAAHLRPVTSDARVFRNGLTAQQEAMQLRERGMALVRQHRPELEGTAWFKRVYLQRHSRSRWQILSNGLGRPLRRWLERST